MAKPGYIHQRAVKMLIEALHGAYSEGGQGRLAPEIGETPVRVRRAPDCDIHPQDIAEGVDKVKVPDPDWDSIGGIVPDLILYGQDDKPVRIVEVIVTSPPTEQKRKKLDAIRRRGVDVVEIKVQTEDDLLKMLERPEPSRLARKLMRGRDEWGVGADKHNYKVIAESSHGKGRAAEGLIKALLNSTPYERQVLADILRRLDSLDSLYPVSEQNGG